MKLIAHHLHAAEPQRSGRLSITNDVDPRGLALSGLTRIDLCFPKFTDGRAYSQAYLLRRRLGFVGELRATGDVKVVGDEFHGHSQPGSAARLRRTRLADS